MRTAKYLLMVALATFIAAPALAHHPGQELDELMGSKEKYFQLVDRKAPDFALHDGDGQPVALADFRGRVVVLHFVYAGCPDVCPLHAERIAKIQEMVNQTPMKGRVQFLTITTDPVRDTSKVMREYGVAHGLNAVNWTFLTSLPGQPEDTTRRLAERFGHKFLVTDDRTQIHGVVTHVIDRNGRWAANFHGLRFDPLNVVLYLNALTNTRDVPTRSTEPSFWDKLRNLF